MAQKDTNDRSIVAPSDPSIVREDVLNTSTSSGLDPEDEATGSG